MWMIWKIILSIILSLGRRRAAKEKIISKRGSRTNRVRGQKKIHSKNDKKGERQRQIKVKSEIVRKRERERK